ncbi:MAG: HypC/HybG/HupF family hydrogenase formation chaperone [Burkholderiales bacterium]|nr:HypC/HybG/HupF family hydrogenase formation chaperone [Burkholderiales bacterium]
MCLAAPMRIVEIDGFEARCEARGIERRVSLFLLQHEASAPGDMVPIHVGHAMQKVSAEEAEASWALFDEMLAADAAARRGGG